jgi:hypothetical protein
MCEEGAGATNEREREGGGGCARITRIAEDERGAYESRAHLFSQLIFLFI